MSKKPSKPVAIQPQDEDIVKFLNTRVPLVVLQRLKAESRRKSFGGHHSIGKVISALVMKHLPPAPEEGLAPKKARGEASEDYRATA